MLFQIIFTVIGLLVFYIYRKHKNNVWEKLGIDYMPGVPLFGNDLRFALGFEPGMDSQMRKYRAAGDKKYIGTHLFSSPFLLIRDPSLVESVLIKDFTHFYDRGMPVNEKADPLLANLFNLAGKRWKRLRNKLSPVFTSGKLKTMHHQILDCADVLMQVLDEYARSGETCDVKETSAKFTTDVIGSCAYGLTMNSMREDNNRFRVMGQRVFQTGFMTTVKMLFRQVLRSIHPNLVTWLGIKSVPKELDDFFFGLMKDTIAMRESDPKYSRNDFVQLLINLRREDDLAKNTNNANDSDDVVLDDKIMAANAFIFFVAGFETTASTISYCLFELSKNQNLQEKLTDEIKNVLSRHDDQPTYDAIKDMPLLDAVISETLRKYPPAPLLIRVCTEEYKIPGDVVIPKGTRIEIPVYSLHHDSTIYPDPEAFKPERFFPENRDQIPKGAYLPFGDGPRICIGARFAQMELKVALAKILSKFRVTKNASMPDEIVFDSRSLFVMIPKGGILLDVHKR